MDEEDVAYVYVCVCVCVYNRLFIIEHYSAKEKEWNNAVCSNMDGPRDYHTKWSKSDRERQICYTYMWNRKNSINELIYQTETDL